MQKIYENAETCDQRYIDNYYM